MPFAPPAVEMVAALDLLGECAALAAEPELFELPPPHALTATASTGEMANAFSSL
jgi:hypothetical protein